MTPLVPPIVLTEDHDLQICATVEVAERFLEYWAVEDGSAYGFDATGRRLAFRVEQRPTTGPLTELFGSTDGLFVRIDPAEEEPSGEAELLASLQHYVRAVAPSERVDSLSIASLIAVARRTAEVR